jgi:hypothetical protein
MGSGTYTIATYKRNPENSADCYMVEAFHCDAAGSPGDAFKGVKWQQNPDPTLLLRTYTLASSFLYEEVCVVTTTDCYLHTDLANDCSADSGTASDTQLVHLAV